MNVITSRSRGASPAAIAATDNGRSADSNIAQKPEILVQIDPTVKDLPATHSEPHERNAKKIVEFLRKTYGSGNLLDPMGMCVIPDPQRYLVAGIYTFIRNLGVSKESRKFERADYEEAVHAAHFHQYTFVDGHETSELPPPLVTSKPARSSVLATRALCGKGTNEPAASKKLAQRHEEQLRRLGTNMGSGGYQALDLRARTDLLDLYTDQHWYSGAGFDFALVPRAVSEEGVAGRIRVGFVHHWSGVSKEEYAAALQSAQDSSTGRVEEDWLEGSHPRAILGLLAARCEQEEEAPVDVVVTDGVVFDLLQSRCDGSNVVIYYGLDGDEAYHALSQALEQDARVKPARKLKQDAGVEAAQGEASQKPLPAPIAKRPRLHRAAEQEQKSPAWVEVA